MSISGPINESKIIKRTKHDSARWKHRTFAYHDPRVPLTEGSELSGYRIGKLLGAGSFSLVYNAIEEESGLPVVVKEYFPKHYAKRKRSGLVSPLEGIKRTRFNEGLKLFFKEARALEKIRHPSVLEMHNLFRANRTAYLVSVNFGGRDLKWFLKSMGKPLDEALVYKVFLPVLSAVNCLHTSCTLHLDIKPANILLQPNGKSLLLDFGAAQGMAANERATKAQVVTHGFAPPEQYGKNQALGPWSDIYAIAASLYFSIVGKMPGKSKDSSTSWSIDIDRYGRRYSPTLLQAINQALSHDPSTRFDCVDRFAEALLVGTKWASLEEYEDSEMGFDRSANEFSFSQDSSTLIIAA